MFILPITPATRTLRLVPTGDTSACLAERTREDEPEALVEIRDRAEALRVIRALVVAFQLPALPESFGKEAC